MFNKRPRTERELKKLFTNLKRKGITDDMAHILIELCYNGKQVMRTSGFYWPGGPDVLLNWNDATRILSLTPREPNQAGTGADEYNPHFRFYSWAGEPILNRIYEPHDIELPNEEGLYAVFFDVDEETGNQTLHVTKNPTLKERAIILVKKVLVSYIYWNYDQQKALFFGDDRHGSEINSHQHWITQSSGFAKRFADGGLKVTGYMLNEDGSSNDHVAWDVTPGSFWHGDFSVKVSGSAFETYVMYWELGLPRMSLHTLPVRNNGLVIAFNNGTSTPTAVTNEKFVLYHAFATNDLLDSHHIISVMGRYEYDSLAYAYSGIKGELVELLADMPQTGKCHLATFIYEVDYNYTNTPKARMVGIADANEVDGHPPVSIASGSEQYLSITEDQELSISLDSGEIITQTDHGFVVGQAIRHDGSAYLLAQADSVINAAVVGIVSNVIDENTFEISVDGFIPNFGAAGEEYFLSPDTAGERITLSDPEVWNVGEVRLSLGWGTNKGWKVEIAVGEVITELPVIRGFQGPQGQSGQDGTSVTIKGSVTTETNLPASSDDIGDGYITQDTGHLWVWDGSEFNDVGLVRGPQGFQGFPGERGFQGFPGERGFQGFQGNIGAQGYPGTRGSLWGSGTVDPTGGLGKLPHDMYINRSTGDLFEFSSSYWIKIMNLIGDPGPQGPQGEIGVASTVPGPQGPQGMPGTSEWTDAGSFIYPTESDDRVVIGANLYDNINDILQIFGSTLFKVTDSQAIKIQESADGNPVITVFDGSMFHESIEFINEDKAVLVKRYLGLKQQFTPNNPPEGGSYIWQDISGNIKIKITKGSVTKTTTLIDFNSL